MYEITLQQVNQPGLPEPVPATAAEQPPAQPPLDEEEADAAEPSQDVALKEAKRILLDWIRFNESAPALVGQGRTAAVSPK